MPDGAQQAVLFNMIQFQLKPEDTPFHGPYFHVVGWCERVTLALGTTCVRAGTVYQKSIFFSRPFEHGVGKGTISNLYTLAY